MSRIVISARRANPVRTVRVVAIAAVILGAGVLASYFIYDRMVSYVVPGGSVPKDQLEVVPGSGGAASRLGYGKSSVAHVGRVRVLRLVGKPHTLGASHGRLTADSINRLFPIVQPSITRTVGTGGWFGGWTYPARFRWNFRMLDDGIPGHQLVEIAGLSRGADKTSSTPGYEELLRQQALLDVGVAVPWSPGHDYHAVARSLSFITTLRGPSGDRLLIGRSFGLPGLADGGQAAADELTVSFVRAEGAIPYASIGWPGMVGVVSGINAEGIAIMVHPVRTADVRMSRTAQPSTLLAREILESARTLKDALGAIEKSKPLGAASYVVVDGNARTWAVVERSPIHSAVIRSPSSPVITDLLAADPFTDDPENDRARRIRPAAMRSRRVVKLLRSKPPAKPEDAAAILRDDRAPDGTTLPLGHRGAVQDVCAQHAALIDASAMVLWVAEGPGASGSFRAFDLRYELRGEGARPAPPADLPPDPTFDTSRARAVLATSADLQAARKMWRSGNKRRARELVQRALVRTPDLPEALKMAGDYARAGKDHERAAEYYRRYLQVGADDMGAKLEVKALLRNH